MPAAKGTTPWNKGLGHGWTDKRGYRWIYVEENGRRRAKREHRHVMEAVIGRRLAPEEVVHHINGIKSDNRPENLEIVEWGVHTAEHHHGRRHSEYAKRTQAVLAEYRQELERTRLLNAELLDALCTLLNRLDGIGGEHVTGMEGVDADLMKANAAIAKATGEAQ